MTISHWKDECVLLNYSMKSNNSYSLKASFELGHINLYGGPIGLFFGLTHLNWPLEKSNLLNDPYMIIESDQRDGKYYHAILEPYFLFSNGYYIYVDNDVPLFLTSSKNKFELKAMTAGPYQRQDILALNFALCKLSDVREAHKHAIHHFLEKPSTLPDVRPVTQPVWTTWDVNKFSKLVKQTAILDFAKGIIDNGFGGRLVIGHKWEKYLGQFKPDTSYLPDFKSLINEIKNLNLTVALRVQPYFSCAQSSSQFHHLLSQEESSYLMHHGDDYGRFHDFYGYGAYVDFTNPKALNWFQERLLQLQKTYGIDSLEFDSGDYDSLRMNTSIPNPVATIIRENSKLLAGLHSDIVINVARGTQKYGFFLSMPLTSSSPRVSIKAVIPRLLQMNILGYSFILPNIIGYNLGTQHGEIFIRWVQLSVFMPTMQFSMHRPPWSYDKEVPSY